MNNKVASVSNTDVVPKSVYGRQCKAGEIIYPHVPIPITVPYSLFELSCAVATGHKHIIMKEAKIRREREEAMHHDLAQDGKFGLPMIGYAWHGSPVCKHRLESTFKPRLWLNRV